MYGLAESYRCYTRRHIKRLSHIRLNRICIPEFAVHCKSSSATTTKKRKRQALTFRNTLAHKSATQHRVDRLASRTNLQNALALVGHLHPSLERRALLPRVRARNYQNRRDGRTDQNFLRSLFDLLYLGLGHALLATIVSMHECMRLKVGDIP